MLLQASGFLGVRVPDAFDDGKALWAAVREELQGAVAKAADKPYRSYSRYEIEREGAVTNRRRSS